MLLTDLPTELLLHTLSYLHGADVELVAKTFNKCLTSLCSPFLKDRMATRLNARRMFATFPRASRTPFFEDLAFHHSSFIWTWYEQLRRYGPFTPKRSHPAKVIPCSELVELKRQFDWLFPWEELIPYDEYYIPFVNCGTWLSDKQIELLKKQAEGLGLEIPKGFFAFVRSTYKAYGQQKYSAKIKYVSLDEGGLKKIKGRMWRPRTDTQDTTSEQAEICETIVDGYMIDFFHDDMDCWHMSLFLDAGSSGPAGEPGKNPGHCIVSRDDRGYVIHSSPQRDLYGGCPVETDKDCLSPLERELEIEMANLSLNEVSLVGTGFEEFLARGYVDVMAVIVYHAGPDQIPQEPKYAFIRDFQGSSRQKRYFLAYVAS